MSLRDRRAHYRHLTLEHLEDRSLLAALVISETFKPLTYQGTGTFSGRTIYLARNPPVQMSSYSGSFQVAGKIDYTSNVAGTGLPAQATGSGSGSERCPPGYSNMDSFAFSFTSHVTLAQNGSQLNLGQTTTSFNYTDAGCDTP